MNKSADGGIGDERRHYAENRALSVISRYRLDSVGDEDQPIFTARPFVIISI